MFASVGGCRLAKFISLWDQFRAVPVCFKSAFRVGSVPIDCLKLSALRRKINNLTHRDAFVNIYVSKRMQSLHFLHAKASARELNSIDRFCQLIKFAKSARTCAARNLHQRVKWAPFQQTKWLFWLPQGFFNHWKNTILPIFSSKRGGLTRLCCGLAILLKNVRLIPLFSFQSLKSNKIAFSLGQHVLQKRTIGFVIALYG